MMVTIIFISSAFIGGFVGALIGYKTMYKSWRTYRDNFFDKQVKELSRKSEYQKRWNDEMYNLTKRMCKRLDKIEG